jgi:hypothetical protein
MSVTAERSVPFNMRAPYQKARSQGPNPGRDPAKSFMRNGVGQGASTERGPDRILIPRGTATATLAHGSMTVATECRRSWDLWPGVRRRAWVAVGLTGSISVDAR